MMVVMIAQRATFAESRRVRAPLLFGDGQWPRIRTEGDALVRRLNPTSSLPTFLPSTSAPFSLRAPLGSSSLKSCPTTELSKGENAENDSLPVDCGQNERWPSLEQEFHGSCPAAAPAAAALATTAAAHFQAAVPRRGENV